jgi:NAD+ kinase
VVYEVVGFLYHPSVPAARVLAEELHHALVQEGLRAWHRSAWDESAAPYLATTDLLVCIGGDGTMLRGARSVIPHPIPILGINMGRVGFLSEVAPRDALPRLREVLAGAGRIERRTMLQAEVALPGGAAPADLRRQHALNDVAVGRFGGRPVYVHIIIDGVRVAVIRADGVVVSTATGSTGYNLSAGGPVLYPEADELVLTPIAAHVAHVRPIVLPADTRIELRVETDLRAVVSFDGQVDYPIQGGTTVHLRRSEHVARLIRLGPPADFFRNLTQLLDFSHRVEPRD